MKWLNYVLLIGLNMCHEEWVFNVEYILIILWFSDGLNYIKFYNNNTIMLLVPEEHNYR
jgi:hypothetical protein